MTHEDPAIEVTEYKERETHILETGQGSLLIVDDSEVVRDMLSHCLEQQGYTVAVAENGRQALEMIRALEFDLILLDIMMPEMNGYQVLECLKADETLRHIPVIVISAVEELDSVVRCIEMGAEDYLPKLFDEVLLKARISACLEKKRLRPRGVVP
ncbi:MAG: response regulator, partial [Nitrospira sp.]|nr:response regulator [Nitrospira sp.]